MTNNLKPRNFFKKIAKPSQAFISYAGSIRLISKKSNSHNSEDLVTAVQELPLVEIATQAYDLENRMNDYKIFQILGGKEKITFAKEELAKRALNSNQTDAHGDRKVNIVYYYDTQQDIKVMYRYWKDANWHYHKKSISSFEDWGLGVRVIFEKMNTE